MFADRAGAMAYSEKNWFTVFMAYDHHEAAMQLEARSQELAEWEAINAFIEDLDDEEVDFEEVDTRLIRFAIVIRTYKGRLSEEPTS